MQPLYTRHKRPHTHTHTHTAVLSRGPLSLTVTLSLKYWQREVVLGVDGRVGQIILSLQPPCLVEGVASRLEEIRRTLTTSNNDLPSQLSLLQ